MGHHSPHPSAGNKITHLGQKAAQTQVPVKEHDTVEGRFKPETADPSALERDVDKKRRDFTPGALAQLPARIDIPIKRHTPSHDDKQINVGVRGFPAAGERAKKHQPLDFVPQGLEGPRRQLLQDLALARSADGKRQGWG